MFGEPPELLGYLPLPPQEVRRRAASGARKSQERIGAILGRGGWGSRGIGLRPVISDW